MKRQRREAEPLDLPVESWEYFVFFISQLAGIIMSKLTDYIKESPLCEVR